MDTVPDYLESEYAKELTEESYREIARLALWSKMRGPRFYLIGGWAAWRYHRGLGSKDIDIVFPGTSLLEPFLRDYYRRNGYERQPGLIESSYRKPVTVGSRTFYIEIDAAPIDKGPPFHEDGTLNLPYTLLLKHHKSWIVGGEEVLTPTVELLLLQKVKAHRDRSWDLAHLHPEVARASYLGSKIRKDAYDIRNLAPHVREWGTVGSIAKAHSCVPLVEQTLKHVGIRGSL